MRNARGISGSFRFALKDQGLFRQVGLLAAEVLDLVFIAAAQIVEAQAVKLRVHDGAQLCLKLFALCRVQKTLEYRALHPLAVIDTLPGDLPQSLFSSRGFRIDVVGDQNQHKLLISIKTGDIRPNRLEGIVPEAVPEDKGSAPREPFLLGRGG